MFRLTRSMAPAAALLAATFALLPAPAHAATVQAFNWDLEPDLFAWNDAIDAVGWSFTASSTFNVASVSTKFSTQHGVNVDSNRTMTLELYQGLPTLGGTLLASTSFNATLGGISTAVLAPAPTITLNAGNDYFVGFRNIGGFGVNVASYGDGASIPPGQSVSPLYVISSGDSQYHEEDSFGITTNAILMFDDGQPPVAPLPAAAWGGIALLARLSLARRRRPIAGT